MPVIAIDRQQFPAWCELEHFDIIALDPGETHTFDHHGVKEKLIIGRGVCSVRFGDERVNGDTRTNVDLTGDDDVFTIDNVTKRTIAVRMAGRWGDDLGGSGLFYADNVGKDQRTDKGDAVDYDKHTNFDSHWHDCDEYWIVFDGKADVASEGKHYTVVPGDCLATGMGHHHDVRYVHEPLNSVYLETTMMGQKRRGHLWNHTHGPAQPRMDRV